MKSIVAALVLLSMPALATTYTVLETDNVSYGPQADETLDLFQPVGATGPLKMVIAMHGGGWVNYNKSSDDPVCRLEAARGYVCASINYPLVQGEATDGTINPAETTYWPCQINGAQLAVRWARANSTSLGISRSKILTYGESAGATLALLTGSMAGTASGAACTEGDVSGLYSTFSSKASAVVDVSGVADLQTIGLIEGIDRAGGLMDSDDPAVLRLGSPVTYIRSTSAPTVVVNGNQDPLLPYSQVQELIDKLNQYIPNTYELISYDGGHVFKDLPLSQKNAIINGAIDIAFSYVP